MPRPGRPEAGWIRSQAQITRQGTRQAALLRRRGEPVCTLAYALFPAVNEGDTKARALSGAVQTRGSEISTFGAASWKTQEKMSRSQSQGSRSGEGTSGLWNHVREDEKCKAHEPDSRPDEQAQQQYGRDAEQQHPDSQR